MWLKNYDKTAALYSIIKNYMGTYVFHSIVN